MNIACPIFYALSAALRNTRFLYEDEEITNEKKKEEEDEICIEVRKRKGERRARSSWEPYLLVHDVFWMRCGSRSPRPARYELRRYTKTEHDHASRAKNESRNVEEVFVGIMKLTCCC